VAGQVQAEEPAPVPLPGQMRVVRTESQSRPPLRHLYCLNTDPDGFPAISCLLCTANHGDLQAEDRQLEPPCGEGAQLTVG